MLKEFGEHIESKFPYLKEAKLLVACSGGLDSTVLVHLCHRAGLEIALAHCNYQLRGAESDGDAEFVKQLAKNLGLQFYSETFNTETEVENRGGSVQMVARDLRYELFQNLLQEQKFEYLLTGHHADDALETFLINLSRGTGIAGLTGIPAKNEKIIRPLLEFSRSEIIEFANTHEISWREDSSNAESKYLRNKVRNKVVPELKSLHPAFLENFKNSQNRLIGVAAMLENTKLGLQSKLFEQKGKQTKISIESLKKLQPLAEYLYLLFNEFGFSEWNDVANLLTAMSGKMVSSKTHTLLKDREYLILSELSADDSAIYTITAQQKSLQRPINLSIEKVNSLGKEAQNVQYVDKEKLNYPLILRKWQNGDYFYPLGMKGKKKLSKFFKDEKVDLNSKKDQWLLCSAENIVWVLGRRLDERYKVTENTKEIIKITWLD